MCGTSRRLSLALAFSGLLAVCSAGALDVSEVPPFDVSRTYSVPGATLEELRLAWKSSVESSQAAERLTGELRTSFSEYRKTTNVEKAALVLLAVLEAAVLLFR